MPNTEQIREEFFKNFGNVWEYEEAHTVWWLSILSQQLSKQREEIEKEVQNMSYAGVLESNEARRGYDIARAEFLSIIK